MTTEELIPILEKRISNCEKRIEEVKKNPYYVSLEGALTTEGIYWVRHWEGKMLAYKRVLKDIKEEK